MQFTINDQELKDLISNTIKECLKDQTSNKPVKRSKNDILLDEIDNWVPLRVAWKKMGISKLQWYRKYQHIIKHRTYAATTWVYLPSILKFFEDDAIN